MKYQITEFQINQVFLYSTFFCMVVLTLSNTTL